MSMIYASRTTAPFRQGVKKTAQLGTGPREPKSVAKLQPIHDTAKYFSDFFQKKRAFPEDCVVWDTRVDVSGQPGM